MQTKCCFFAVGNLLLLGVLAKLSWEYQWAIWPSIALGACQLASLATFSACAELPKLDRIRWTYQLLAGQWIFVAIAVPTDSLTWPLVFCTFVNQLIVFAAAFSGAKVASVATNRSLSIESKTPIRRNPIPINLLDLVVFTSIVAVVAWKISRCHPVIHEDAWTGFGYNLLLIGGLMLGLPTGFMIPPTLIGTLLDDRHYSSKWIGGWFAFVILVLTAGLGLSNGYGDANGLTIFLISLAIPAIVITMFFRWHGVRFRKKNRLADCPASKNQEPIPKCVT